MYRSRQSGSTTTLSEHISCRGLWRLPRSALLAQPQPCCFSPAYPGLSNVDMAAEHKAFCRIIWAGRMMTCIMYYLCWWLGEWTDITVRGHGESFHKRLICCSWSINGLRVCCEEGHYPPDLIEKRAWTKRTFCLVVKYVSCRHCGPLWQRYAAWQQSKSILGGHLLFRSESNAEEHWMASGVRGGM